jgi:16S rRNA (guanine966-N2)-methyltransferase
MRITGGMWRSRRLKGPRRGMAVRPTPDAMRERAFAVLGDTVEDARVLDLFAGTGAVGLEALSRGADSVVFVERDRAVARILRENLESLNDDLGTILVRAAAPVVLDLARRGQVFDLVWADPPFDRWRLGLEVLEKAANAEILEPTATLCLECPADAKLPHAIGGCRLNRDLTGSASRVAIYRSHGSDF